MKLATSAIEDVLRRKASGQTYDKIAATLLLPRWVVCLVVKHGVKLQNQIRLREAAIIPGTSDSQWYCPSCASVLEYAPCIRCGSKGREPRLWKPRQAAIANAPGIREVSSVVYLT